MKTINIFRRVWLVISLILVLFTSQNLLAQTTANEQESTATLEETMNWLGSRLTDKNFFSRAGIGNDFIGSIFDVENSFEVDKCRLKIVWKDKSNGSNLSVDFTDINPNPTLKDNGIDIETITGEKRISYRNYRDDYQSTASGAKLMFESKENAERVYRAIKHAAKLCGAKSSPF